MPRDYRVYLDDMLWDIIQTKLQPLKKDIEAILGE